MVGIDSHIEDMKSMLNAESKDVRIVGICGMGGIGKTTLAQAADWFALGSRIIITTRDVHLLNAHKVHEIYKLKGLDFGQSLQLFSRHAFGNDHSPKDLENLAMLQSLKKIQPNDIMEKLKISYDGLNEEREIFLDIACFFIGSNKKEAINIWKSCGFSPNVGIKNLIHKSLIDIVPENKLRMHDQLRDMARQIVRQEQLDEPGERNRLWSHVEVLVVMKQFMGTRKVKGLLLKLEEQDTASEESHFSTGAFVIMPRLRLLHIDNANLVGSFKHFPSKLRWLCWKRCPLESLPTDFHVEKLVVFDLSYSKIMQVWNGWHQNARMY